MFELVKNLSSHKVSTLEGFIEVLKRENCETVVTKLHRIAKNSTLVDLYYKLRFIATTPYGKRVVYMEEFYVRLGSEDSDGGRTKLLLFAEQRVGDLRENLPGVQAALMDP